jgi:hypothetical protein
MRTKVLWSIAVLLVTAGTVRAADANDVKAALANRIKSLQNVMVTYDFRSEPNQRGRAERNRQYAGRQIEVAVGTEEQCKLYYLDGKIRCELKRTPSPDPVVVDGITMVEEGRQTWSSSVEIQADGSSQRLLGYQNNTVFEGLIDTRVVTRGDMILEPMGVAAGRKSINTKALASSKVTATNKDGATLEFAGPRGSAERWRLSAEHGYAPASQESVDADGFVWSKTEMNDWKKVGDAWVAYMAVKKTFSKAADGTSTEGSENLFTVKNCQVGSKENVPALYKMVWPDGTRVRSRDGKNYEAQGGELKPVETEAK